MLQVDPAPVTSAELLEDPALKPMIPPFVSAGLVTGPVRTLPTLETVMLLPDPSYPTVRLTALLQVDPAPVTSAELLDAVALSPMTLEP